MQSCILQAGLQDLGIDKITFDGVRGGVVLTSVSADSKFKRLDLVRSVSMLRADGSRTTVDFETLDQFQEILFENARKPGTTIVLTRIGAPETGGGSSFVTHKY